MVSASSPRGSGTTRPTTRSRATPPSGKIDRRTWVKRRGPGRAGAGGGRCGGGEDPVCRRRDGPGGAAGMVMVRGECLPLAVTVPLLPVAGAVGELARVDDGGLVAAALDAVPGYVREEVARLVPGLGPSVMT